MWYEVSAMSDDGTESYALRTEADSAEQAIKDVAALLNDNE